jgi:hypothetical protein
MFNDVKRFAVGRGIKRRPPGHFALISAAQNMPLGVRDPASPSKLVTGRLLRLRNTEHAWSVFLRVPPSPWTASHE